jgi:hypothetical protein
MQQVPEFSLISDLVQMVEDGKLAIPEFQRPFVWKPPAVADLLVSVARRWPIGTLLLLEGPQDFAVRPLAEAPELNNVELLLLDGQQRMTALYRALGDHVGDEIYYVDFNALREEGELTDDHIRVRQRKAFQRQYPDLARRARAGVALVREVADPDQFQEWLQQHSPDELKEFSQLRNAQLAGLQDYQLPGVRLKRNIGFDVLAKIFETINRTGVRLATFDLMVARMYPRNFDLRREWKDAQDSHEDLRAFGVDGMELLRLIALLELLREVRVNTMPRRVKGIRQGDVLALDAEVVKREWATAVAAYVSALQLVRERCGVVNQEILPSPTMLLPIASTLAQDSDKGPRIAARFFWAAGLTQSYSQGANTRAVKDARDLQAYLDGNGVPEIIERAEVDQETLLDSRRRNEVLLRTLTCMLVREGGRDWLTGDLLSQAEGPLIEHAVFPEHWLRARGIVSDALLNWTLQSQATHEDLGETEPRDVATREDLIEGALVSQAVERNALLDSDWGLFSEHRARELRDRLEALVREVRQVAG